MTKRYQESLHPSHSILVHKCMEKSKIVSLGKTDRLSTSKDCKPTAFPELNFPGAPSKRIFAEMCHDLVGLQATAWESLGKNRAPLVKKTSQHKINVGCTPVLHCAGHAADHSISPLMHDAVYHCSAGVLRSHSKWNSQATWILGFISHRFFPSLQPIDTGNPEACKTPSCAWCAQCTNAGRYR